MIVYSPIALAPDRKLVIFQEWLCFVKFFIGLKKSSYNPFLTNIPILYLSFFVFAGGLKWEQKF